MQVSFLPTESDYVMMCLERQKYLTPKENRVLFPVAGIIDIVCGTLGMILRGESVFEMICWLLLIAAGLLILSYYDVIKPFFIAGSAASYYRYHQKDINSKTICINAESITVSDELHRISVPREYVYKIYQAKKTLFIFLDQEEFIYIPGRVIEEMPSLNK